MSNKKNKTKKNRKNFLTLAQEILTISGGIAGSIMAIYGFIKTFRDDASGFGWLIFLGLAIWLIVLWEMFQRQKLYAYSWLILTVMGGAIAWVGWQGQVQAQEDKVIVLVAKFDGPEEEYGLREEMIEQLRETTKDYDDTEIIASEEVVTVTQGSEYAYKLGEKHHADLVIWAWYRSTNDPNITIHIENLSSEEISALNESETYKPEAALVDLESFEIQRRLGSETSTLISFITGIIQFKSGNIEIAIGRLENILNEDDISTYINPRDVNFMLGYMYGSTGRFEQSLFYVDEAIRLDPNYSALYNFRGLVYLELAQYDTAMNNFNTALQLNPTSAVAFHNRGLVNHKLNRLDEALSDYSQSIRLESSNPQPYNGRAMIHIKRENYELALADLEQAITINPAYADAYGNLGVVFYEQKKYEQAMDNFNITLQIDPQNANTYYNRGNLYFFVQENYELAIEDYSKAIELGTTINSVFIHRCKVYFTIGKLDLALDDCNKAIELMPNLPLVYYNRGYLLEAIGRTAEANADFAKYKELTGQDAP